MQRVGEKITRADSVISTMAAARKRLDAEAAKSARQAACELGLGSEDMRPRLVERGLMRVQYTPTGTPAQRQTTWIACSG